MCSALLSLLLLLSSDAEVVKEYDHRYQVVSDQLAKRREHLRLRLRALYKLQRGGYARLFVESSSRADFFARRAAASRILERDLAELHLFQRERKILEQERTRLAQMAAGSGASLAPLELRPPLPGAPPILAHAGPYRDADSGLLLSRRGLLLAAARGGPVLAPAHGTVVFAGELPDQGGVVILQHDGDLYTVLGGLGRLSVTLGTRVAPGDRLGATASSRLLLQVRRGATSLDPEPLLRHTRR